MDTSEVPEAADFLAAATTLVELCSRIDPDSWTRPALGSWDLRALVGHTLRAVTTVQTYLAEAPPVTVDCATAADYFLAVRSTAGSSAGVSDAEVADRGVQAGAALGHDPIPVVVREVEAARTALTTAPTDRLVTTAAGGMRLRDYLPTRTFELAAHCLDISAVGPPVELPRAVMASTARTAAEVCALSGDPQDGQAFLRHLLGRPGGAHRPMFARARGRSFRAWRSRAGPPRRGASTIISVGGPWDTSSMLERHHSSRRRSSAALAHVWGRRAGFAVNGGALPSPRRVGTVGLSVLGGTI